MAEGREKPVLVVENAENPEDESDDVLAADVGGIDWIVKGEATTGFSSI